MSSVETHELNQLTHNDSSDVWNKFIMHRENKIVTHGILLMMAVKIQLRKLYRSSIRYKNAADNLETFLKNMASKSIPEDKVNSVKVKEAQKIKQFLKEEQEEPESIKNLLKSMNSVENNELNERSEFVNYISKIYSEGYNSNNLQIALKGLHEILNLHRKDLKDLIDSYALFAGEIKGYNLNRTINKMNTLFKKGRVSQRWMMINVISKTADNFRARNISKNYPRNFKKYFKKAIADENKGNSDAVQKDLMKMEGVFEKENNAIENLESDINTIIGKFIKEENKISTDLDSKSFEKLRKEHPDLFSQLINLKKVIQNHHVDLANLFYYFRRGLETMVISTDRIIAHVEKLKKQSNNTKVIDL